MMYMRVHERHSKKEGTYFVVRTHCTTNGWSWEEYRTCNASDAREYVEKRRK